MGLGSVSGSVGPFVKWEPVPREFWYTGVYISEDNSKAWVKHSILCSIPFGICLWFFLSVDCQCWWNDGVSLDSQGRSTCKSLKVCGEAMRNWTLVQFTIERGSELSESVWERRWNSELTGFDGLELREWLIFSWTGSTWVWERRETTRACHFRIRSFNGWSM